MVSTTSLAHYGRIASFPPFKHIRFDQPLRFANLNQIWLAMLGLESPSIAWKETLENLGLFPCCPWSSDGLQHARTAIRHYNELSDPAAARLILSRLPYVYGPNATRASRTEPWLVLGDEVLLEVTKLITKDLQPASNSSRALSAQSQCNTEVVARAMSLITWL
ncbi:hypothetical protein LshimejAT787_2200580 [Lyophyllum shimeji]|uniref:Uncharacterized protein n=1 Tax=Lyophyllum shimeji TaxID=47721 RepID=A0A9P3Q0I6_LYOSH|nr:hypothetical protein LshimejAT787_2200580 [Lyophyllum shimeji]